MKIHSITLEGIVALGKWFISLVKMLCRYSGLEFIYRKFNPVDNKRYFLGRPNDAFAIMRAFGLGITNANLSKIPAK